MMRQLTLPDGLTVFSLNPDETRFVHREIFVERCYLRHGVELADGDCVFDAGAHIGMAAIFFHQERRGIRIFAFEPSPAACACLRANIALHGVQAQVFECGLGRASGTGEFTYYPGNTVTSGFYTDRERDQETTRTYMVNSGVPPHGADRFAGVLFKKEEKFSRPLRTLSEIVDEQHVDRVDLLKINVEKSEAEVLAGIREEHWGLIRQIALEVYDDGGRLDAVQTLLARQGFTVSAEQEPLLRGTPLYSVFGVRPNAPAKPGLRS
jgi:31-O-methyltransferase